MWDPFTTAASSPFWNLPKLRAWVDTSRICVKVLLVLVTFQWILWIFFLCRQ